MNQLMLIWLAAVRLLKRAGLFPETLVKSSERRRLQTVASERETERLDRIRNPSKYLGKDD